MTLYELKGQYMELMELAGNPETDEQIFLDTLEGMEGEIAEKLEAYQVIRTTLDNDCSMFDSEILRLKKIQSQLSRKSDLLRQRMFEMVKLLPDQKLTSDHYKFSVVKNGGKAPLLFKEGAVIPDEFLKVITEPDNEKIREGIDSGVVDFAYLGERGTRLSIK